MSIKKIMECGAPKDSNSLSQITNNIIPNMQFTVGFFEIFILSCIYNPSLPCIIYQTAPFGSMYEILMFYPLQICSLICGRVIVDELLSKSHHHTVQII